MLAYVFWHWPSGGQDTGTYARRLLAFHRALKAAPPAGLLDCFGHRVAHPPWDRQGAAIFEDWYLVEGFAALGTLNDAAVDESRRRPHDQVADMSLEGRGGVYRLVHGVPDESPRSALWFGKPPGKPYADFIDSWRFRLEESGATLWQRQLVLGPAPEFCTLFKQELPGPETVGMRPVTLQQLRGS